MTKPRVYTLCGSTRFPDAFALANMHLSLLGHVVIGLGMMSHADEPRGARFLTAGGDEETPAKGRVVHHFRKIDLSDAIYVVNVGGYVGFSTRREIVYAYGQGRDIEWMFGEDQAWDEHREHDMPDKDCGYCPIRLAGAV